MLNNLPSPKSTRPNKIVGRGTGSGKGAHTVGRGMNGQRSRSGYRKPGPAFEGGQNPISRRIPLLKGESKKARKRSFILSKVRNVPLKLSRIADTFKASDVVSIEKLIEVKMIKPLSHKSLNVKVVFDKDIDKKLSFEGISLSKTAKAAVEKAGGEVK